MRAMDAIGWDVEARGRESYAKQSACLAALVLISLLVLFANLSGPEFFEPDEGRNAEKAREMLQLGDWVTPHQNFMPTLDKPAGFFWLVALSFKIFGVSEWAARLPAVLAALGCLILVYFFARRLWGEREALWSGLVLLTSVSFFVFARVVIFDMALTFFITLALLSFFAAAQAESSRERSLRCALMYAAFAAGTLIKGLVAVVLPAMTILWYMLATRGWSLLPRLQIGRGALIYFAMVTPWYALAELRNPGYLRYFLVDEHFGRYTTVEFERTAVWYFFIIVLALGFFPWSGLLPKLARDLWRARGDHVKHFLLGWVLLPVLFFSFSKSQLPQYILPVFPGLALIAGRYLAVNIAGARYSWRPLWITWLFAGTVMAYFAAAGFWPALAARYIRTALVENVLLTMVCCAVLLIIFALCVLGYGRRWWSGWRPVYLSTATALAVFFVVLAQLATPLSVQRGSKSLAQVIAPFTASDHRIVFYDTYLPALPFYLSAQKPLWLVQKERRDTIMGSNYLGLRNPLAAGGRGQVVFSFAEFAKLWPRKDLSLRVIVKEKNLRRMSANIGTAPRVLTRWDEYLLVTNH